MRRRAGDEYPRPSLRSTTLRAVEQHFFSKPTGFPGAEWPPRQWKYVVDYVQTLGCQSVIVEDHYIDRDFVDDVALFYSRNLRGYRNYCSRIHFFASRISPRRLRLLVQAELVAADVSSLDEAYLGFLVRRPLPGSPVGRTVLRLPKSSGHGADGTRSYRVHLAGLDLTVKDALAFQQQDQGVSACATTALWTSLHSIAHREGLHIPTPAAITQAASRYYLPGGRALPSEGLTISQMSEACRAIDLSPLIIRAVDLETVRGVVHTLIRSGFPPLLAVEPKDQADGHAVCAVSFASRPAGRKMPQAVAVVDGASSVASLLVHDDRLGPYATMRLSEVGSGKDRRVEVQTLARDGSVFETAVLVALLVPLPNKVRLSPVAMRVCGFQLARALSSSALRGIGDITVSCRYEPAVKYLRDALQLGLSTGGIYDLRCRTALSRYIGLIEMTCQGQPVFDVLLDATETEANPFVLACLRRVDLPIPESRWAMQLATALGVRLLN